MSNVPKGDSDDLIFTTRIRLRNGKFIYASSYGLKAFCFPKPKPKTVKNDGGSNAETN